MIYLTQLTLDLATATTLHICNAYDWHQRVWQCFPNQPAGQRDFLTRLDRQAKGFRLLIVSLTPPTKPSWCPLNNNCWQSQPIPDAYFTHHHYAFQLYANPTKKVPSQNPDRRPKKQGRRVPLDTPDDLLAWITRKGAQGGFTVDQDTLHTALQGRQYFSGPGKRGLHYAVDFKGILTITDLRQFRKTLTHGIGSAKAFGFGLLVIVPTGDPTRSPSKGTHTT